MMNYAAAYETALARFRETPLADVARYSGYPLEDNRLRVSFLGQEYWVEHPSGKFSPEPAAAGELPIFAQILILHYLTNVREVVQTGRLISYKELPGGAIYIQPFANRSIRPLVETFGADPGRMAEAAKAIGGRSVKHGDAAAVVPVFPKVPVTLVIWGADEEFPASGNILFDASASEVLPTEDYAVLAGLVVGTLKGLAANGPKS